MRAFVTPLALLSLMAFPALAAGPTGHLNDTGVTGCLDAGRTFGPCTHANSGDAATYPGQDGRFGRDVAAAAGALTKIGGGAAGFDFTALDATGAVIPLVDGKPSAPPACVKDNVTQLIWEVKTPGNKNHVYINENVTIAQGWGLLRSDLENMAWCGYSTGWRLPTRRELLSIVHFGRTDTAIDTDFFPNHPVSWIRGPWYWTSDSFYDNPRQFWMVDLDSGDTMTSSWFDPTYARLVRDAE